MRQQCFSNFPSLCEASSWDNWGDRGWGGLALSQNRSLVSPCCSFPYNLTSSAWYLSVTCLVIPGLLNAQLPILPERNKYQMTFLNVKKEESFFLFFSADHNKKWRRLYVNADVFAFNRVCFPRGIFRLSFYNLCIHLYVQRMEFQRNYSLEYYHVVCIGKSNGGALVLFISSCLETWDFNDFVRINNSALSWFLIVLIILIFCYISWVINILMELSC